MKILSVLLELLLVCAWMLEAKAENNVALNIEGQKTTAWRSQPFNRECLQGCAHEIVRHSPSGDVYLKNRNCSVDCKGDAVRRRSLSLPILKRVSLRNAVNGARSDCLIQIFTEDIMCVTAQSGIWKVQNRCQRRNYRYQLPHQNCDGGSHLDVGEETCQEACVEEIDRRGQKVISVNVARQRAIFRTCYSGFVSETNGPKVRRYRQNFCRAELIPCSSCFRWGNWTSVNTCSKTCGSPGVRSYLRSCFIMHRSDLYGDGVVLKPINSAHCEEYFGGMDKKTEQCGSYSACPGWTQWGPWSECQTNDMLTSSTSDDTNTIQRKPIKRCRRKKRDIEQNSSAAPQNSKEMGTLDNMADSLDPTVVAIFQNESRNYGNGLMTLRGRVLPPLRRTRKCLPVGSDDSLCRGNSTQYKSCHVTQQSSTTSPEEDDLDDCDENSQQSAAAKTTQKSTVAPARNQSPKDLPTTPPTSEITTRKERSNGRPNNNNQNFTFADDGFSKVINAHAPALIAGLLVFIVLLLAALIAICGARFMQKTRRNRYDVTSPSFSAGTMGSIPSGLVQGFPHVLGLRHGSGTFGRSESAANGFGNFSEAVENCGSCRSIASNANFKGKAQQQHIGSASGLSYGNNSNRKSSPHQKIAMVDLGNRTSESNILSKKPSNSSLLSTGSSACGLPPVVPPHSCSFQPLPPLPPNHPPYPVGNDNSVFKRGTKKSSSLNPVETDRNSRVVAYTQPRAESVSGRVTGRHYDVALHENSSQKKFAPNPVRRNEAYRGFDASSKEEYCRRNRDPGPRDVPSDIVASENEYWSVARPGCLESEGEATEALRSNQNTPRAKPREKTGIKSTQAEKTRENFGKSSLYKKAFQEAEEEEMSTQVEMIDNVLYAQKITTKDNGPQDDDKLNSNSQTPQSERKLTQMESSGENEGQSVAQHEEERVYNTIGLETPPDETESEPSLASEGDYDHLCDQFGSSHSTKARAKYPGTMTSLHYLRNSDDDIDDDDKKSHDYESIDLGGKISPRSTKGPEPRRMPSVVHKK